MNFATKRAKSTITLDDIALRSTLGESKELTAVSGHGAPQLSVPDEAVRIATKLSVQLNPTDQVLLFAGINERSSVSALASHVAKTFTHLEKERVLLVDADLSQPSLHERYGVPLNPGLSEVIEGNVAAPNIALPISGGQLYLLTAGRRNQAAKSVFTSPRCRPFIESLRTEFRFVIFNVAPVLAEVAASLLCRLADGVVLAAPAGRERRRELLAARDELKRLHARILGLVLFEDGAQSTDVK